MKVIKKIALKGLLLAAAFVAMNYAYKFTLWKADLKEYSGITQKIENVLDADILYLGDCSDSYFGKDKEGEKGISQLLDSLLPDKKVATISETGFHAGMYYSILNQVPENSKINTVIVTMNLRSFSAQTINSYINNSINQRMIMLDNDYPALLNRFFLIAKKAKNYSGEEYITMKTRKWKEDKITLNNTPKYKTLYDWKCAYKNGAYINFDENWITSMKEKGAAHIANYAFQIDAATNPRINDFDKIVVLANKRKWKLIFHLLPENMAESKALVGEDLIALINYNRQLLKQRYTGSEANIIDNMDLLNTVDFMEELPNSHYHYGGRRLMAKKIVEYLIIKPDK